MIRITKPSTAYIRFTTEMPRNFVLKNDKGEVYYFRKLDGKTPRIKFNVLHPATYSSDTPFDVVKVTDLELPDSLPNLPAFERDRVKDFRIVFNPSLTGTPARIFTQRGIIETSREFEEFPKQIQDFILWHEIGHFYYETEEKADLFALVNCLKRGYNRSMCFYALSFILKKSPKNTDRLRTLLKNIQKTNSQPLNFD